MRSINITFTILFILFSCSSVLAGDKHKYSVGESGVKIKGVLSNYDEAKSFFQPNTHIFIAKADQKMTLVLTVDGSAVAIDKKFSQASIDKNGSFLFSLTNIQNGKYLLFIQPLTRYGVMKLFDIKTNNPVEVTISDKAPLTKVVELGRVVIGKP